MDGYWEFRETARVWGKMRVWTKWYPGGGSESGVLEKRDER